MKYFKYLLVFLITLCSPSYSGTIDPSTPDSKYVEYGSKFDCIVRVGGTANDGNKDFMFYASGVAIDDHHILTAAHVVNGCKECFVIIKDKKYIISQITIHKDFEKTFGAGDIALGYTDDKLELDFYPSLYDTDDEVGKVCSISGYGLTGTFSTGATRSDDKKRAGSNMIDRTFSDVIVCNPSRRHEKGYTELEFFIASGDSGGGLFIDGKLAGINSCVMVSNRSPNSSYGEEACHTRISKFIGWIRDNKKKMD